MFKHSPSVTPPIMHTDKKWQVYPNPTTDIISVKNGTRSNETMTYVVTDIMGRTVQLGEMTNNTDIDVNYLAPGTYFLKMYKGKEDDGHVVFVKN